MDDLPITERSNALSTSIDIASPQDIVKIIGQCEKQVYTGWENFEGLSSPKFLNMMETIATQICSMLKSPKSKSVVLSGCGTSGRIGFMAVRSANEVLKQLGIEPIFDYLIAGDDKALFLSIEAAEDSYQTGIEKLKNVTDGKDEVLFIGITCGLSAPFVAGQLDYCLNHSNFTPVLIGFNPCHMARDGSLENGNKTFRQVAGDLQRAESTGRAFILNPVIGPEPITGSSRMKGGSATKIILDSIVDMTLELYLGRALIVTERFKEYENAHSVTYSASEDIGHILNMAAQSRIADGHVFYVGIDGCGILGIIDASECQPTFGADPEDVTGFLEGGYESLRNNEGDISAQVEMSADHFRRNIWPTLSSNDLVIFLSLDGKLPSIPEIKIPAQTALVLFGEENGCLQQYHFDKTVKLALPIVKEPLESINTRRYVHLVEIMCKWICNAISTGAHIMLGKVCENYMVDVGVRNYKLFYRAVNMIKNYVKVSKDVAECLLLRSIYMTDALTGLHKNSPISSHIAVAASLKKVVPRAFVLGLLKCDVVSAEKVLGNSPRLRTTLKEYMNK